MLNLQINGIDIQVRHGTMVIDAAESIGISIPRFCYHKKLSTAANCRMCLVEVAKVAKPVPACATPVAEGMKVFTRSPKALSAQRGVMEFLLINHPLDCPVCDQGGECPLQETAIGFGSGISRYSLGKRVVTDPDLGPLVSADMTRCIHCTRCVRFSREIAGAMDLGLIGRGEHTKITTYVGYTLDSELSGNVIDLCPVGALTSRPARYKSRAWELQSHSSIAPHDSFGSNLRLDTKDGRVIRVIARECEKINETWISDRDRFSYQGLYSADRLESPRIRENGVWRDVDWSTALEFVANGLNEVRKNEGAQALGALVAPTTTLEESYLVQKLMRGLGSPNIDHRLRQIDFSGREEDPVFPWLGQSIASLENLGAFLVVGSHVRKEHPLINHRLRKAMLRGAYATFLDAQHREYNYPPNAVMVASPGEWLQELLLVAKAAQAITGRAILQEWSSLWKDLEASALHQATARYLSQSPSSLILIGNSAQSHTNFADLRRIVGLLAELTDSKIGYLPEAAGTVGAWLAGCVPHRGPGKKSVVSGLDWRAMLTGDSVKGLLVLGAELDKDCADPVAVHGLKKTSFVVSLSSWSGPAQERYANAILPIAPYAETSGTYVNLEGKWQSFQGAADPVGETRPGWKVLRVLGNLLDLEGFDYFSSEQVLAEARGVIGEVSPNNMISGKTPKHVTPPKGLSRVGETPPYAVDALVRRSPALQATKDGKVAAVARIHSATLAHLGLENVSEVVVRQDAVEVTLPVVADDRMAVGCVSIPASMSETAILGATFGTLELSAPEDQVAI
ncbi:NADH-quinone oxidoreductase [Gammaproteobacteria bacterium]